jgi:hypothetical protein
LDVSNDCLPRQDIGGEAAGGLAHNRWGDGVRGPFERYRAAPLSQC